MMNVLLVQEAPPRLPSVQFVYSQGDYAHSLRCYEDAKEWAIRTGASAYPGLYALIKRPHHEKSPWTERIAQIELQDDPGWNITVDFFCDAAALEWLLAQPVPEMASRIIPKGSATNG